MKYPPLLIQTPTDIENLFKRMIPWCSHYAKAKMSRLRRKCQERFSLMYHESVHEEVCAFLEEALEIYKYDMGNTSEEFQLLDEELVMLLDAGNTPPLKRKRVKPDLFQELFKHAKNFIERTKFTLAPPEVWG